MAKAGDAVKAQKAESELLAAVIAKGGDPTSVPVPWAIKYLQSPITLNQSLLAAINGSIGAPDTEVTLGPEHGSSYHAPWGEPGLQVTCLEAGRMGLRAELANGIHGGREPMGYAGMYGVIYSLAAAHPDPECREIGKKLLAGWLAIFYLLRGYEMGCRADITPEYNVVEILAMLAGADRELSKRDWATASRVFKLLKPKLDLPRITNVEEAAAVLRDSGARCLLGWRWLDYGGGRFGAAIMTPQGCIKKGTGKGLIMFYDGGTGRPVEGLPVALRSLTLGPFGVSLFGPWSLPDSPPPEPAPPPAQPGEEEPKPTTSDPERAIALIQEAQGEVRQGLTGRQAQLVRQKLQEAVATLKGRGERP